MKLKFFGYFMFIAACIIFSLYAHFPGKTAAKYIGRTLSQINSKVKLQIDNVNPFFPPGIKAESILVSYTGTQIAKLNNFKTSLNLTTLFDNVVKGSFKADISDGIMSGIVSVSRGKPREIGIETEFKNLKLKNFQVGKLLPGYKFSGMLGGKVTAGFKQRRILINYGEVNFADFMLQIPEALFSVETYSFSTGKVKFAMPKHNIIKIEECIMKGRQIDIQASGEICAAEKFQKSILNIKARVVLYPMFFMDAGDSMPVDVSKNDSDNAIINLRIKGTIQNPTITVGQGTK